MLSLDTGFKEEQYSPSAPNVRNILLDSAVARLYRASISSLSLDGGNSWRDHWLGLEEDVKGQHFRLDLPIKDKEPKINNVSQIPKLQRQVQHHLDKLKGLARAIKAVAFFFELQGPLEHSRASYKYQGHILS